MDPKAPQQPTPKNSIQEKGSIVEKKTKAKGKKQGKNKSTVKFMDIWFSQYYKQVIIAVCVILLAASYFFILHPKLSNSLSMRGSKYEEILSEQEKLRARLDYLVAAKKIKSTISIKDIENIDNILPKEPNTPQIITSLEDIARQSDVIISGIDLAVMNSEDLSKAVALEEEGSYNIPEGVSVVEVAITVESGPYSKLKGFLENLERNIRIMDVIALTYSPSGKSYNVTIRAYFLP